MANRSLYIDGHIFQVNLGQPFLLQLRLMEVVVTTGAISRAKLQSNHHHQQTNSQLFTGRMPFLSPNQQCQSTEERASRRYKRENTDKDFHSQNMIMTIITMTYRSDGVRNITDSFLLMKWASDH